MTRLHRANPALASPLPSIQAIVREDCLRLLECGTVGRVGFCNDDGQQIIAVNYVCRSGHVFFRTSADSLLAELARGNPDVAFEVDHLELLTQTGWSVLVKGETRAADGLPAGTGQRGPWAGGDRRIVVELVPHAISGRRVRRPATRPRVQGTPDA